ncbi:MAG TPA: hypothetical protein VJ724_12390, partial [Tahibacter sp.]|nr:hypothetical protein [Tahibacter sp.]
MSGLASLVVAFFALFAPSAAALPPTPFAWTPLGDKVSDLGATYVLFAVVDGEPVALYRDAFKGTKTLEPTPDVRYEPALRTWRDGRWIEHPFAWRHAFF